MAADLSPLSTMTMHVKPEMRWIITSIQRAYFQIFNVYRRVSSIDKRLNALKIQFQKEKMLENFNELRKKKKALF